MTATVYVNRSGDKVWSPNSKEQLCEAVECLTAQLNDLRVTLARVTAQPVRCPADTNERRTK